MLFNYVSFLLFLVSSKYSGKSLVFSSTETSHFVSYMLPVCFRTHSEIFSSLSPVSLLSNVVQEDLGKVAGSQSSWERSQSFNFFQAFPKGIQIYFSFYFHPGCFGSTSHPTSPSPLFFRSHRITESYGLEGTCEDHLVQSPATGSGVSCILLLIPSSSCMTQKQEPPTPIYNNLT